MTSYDSANMPEFVTVPKHITIDQAEQAMLICRELGLLKDTTNGVLFFPAGISWTPESGQKQCLPIPYPTEDNE